MYYNNNLNTKKLKPGIVAFYDIRPGNGAGLFSKVKIHTGEDKYGFCLFVCLLSICIIIFVFYQIIFNMLY